jgi:transposase
MEKKSYTKEFKVGAARMVVNEKKAQADVARDLGVSSASMTKWVRDYKKSGNGAFPGKGFLTPEQEQIRKLEKELKRTQMERDLLKKTIVFFAELDRKNSLQ